MNIIDFGNEDGARYGLIDVRASDSIFDDTRRIWRFTVRTDKGAVSTYMERPDIRILEEDEAILSVAAARLWVLGRKQQASLPDGRLFADAHPPDLYQ